jgi:hypothetical protein
VKAGKFKAEDYGHYSMMKYKGSELARWAPSRRRCRPTCGQGAAKEKAILDGKFTVKVDDGQPKEHHEVDHRDQAGTQQARPPAPAVDAPHRQPGVDRHGPWPVPPASPPAASAGSSP